MLNIIFYLKNLVTKYAISMYIILLFFILSFNLNCFSNNINIYCPYCRNKGVEVLNDSNGICRCQNCNRNMLILNGTIKTDDGRELLLLSYLDYDSKNNDELIKKLLASQSEILEKKEILRKQKEQEKFEQNIKSFFIDNSFGIVVVFVIICIFLIYNLNNKYKGREF